MKYNRISADCHLDMPWMPPTLFTEQSKKELKDRMPFVADGPDGPFWTTKSGANFGLLNGVGPGGAKLVPGQNKRVDIMAQTGMFEDGKIGRPEARTAIQRPSDPHLRVKEMERDGVDAEVIFGILGGASKMQDIEAANHMLEIYNDWLVDFVKPYPDRMIGLGCIPYGDPEVAAQEVYRCAKLGLKGVELSCSWDMQPMWDPIWEPMWKACSEVQLPLHFHTFPTTAPQAREQMNVQVRRAAMFTGVSAFQMGLIHILAAMMGAGVFERYPNLRVSFGESGIGWIPYALDRMDFEFEDRFRDLMKLKPSEYWQRQCKATFQYDVIGPKLLNTNNLMTEETLMWGSDYPHTDGIWPESTKYIDEQFAGLSAEQIRKITCDNAAKFYNLTN
jgi:predicted TIM-barrel fold metal-dependent hydrolase